MAIVIVTCEEFTTKREQRMIDSDIKKCDFSYRKGVYTDKNLKLKFPAGKLRVD